MLLRCTYVTWTERSTVEIERPTARAGNRRFWLLSALRAHTKAPYKMDFHRKMQRNAKERLTAPGGRGQLLEQDSTPLSLQCTPSASAWQSGRSGSA
jgi:hypothetical protein